MQGFRRALAGSRLILTMSVLGGLGPASSSVAETAYEMNHGAYNRAADREPPLFGVTVRHYSDVRLKGTQPGTDSNFDVTTLETGRDWNFPVAPDGAGMVGFHFGLRDFHGNGLDETFYSLSFGVGLTWFTTANLRLTADFRPGLYTNFGHDLSGDDWQYLGQIMATYRSTPQLFLRGGLGVTNDFYNVPVIPLLGFSWAPSPAFRLDALAPKEVVARWRPAELISFHAGIFLEGTKYNWKVNGVDSKLFVQDVRAEGGIRLYLMRNFSVSFAGGGIIGGEYRIAGDQADQEGGWFVSLGLGFTF